MVKCYISSAGICVMLLMALVVSGSHGEPASDPAVQAVVYAASIGDSRPPGCSLPEEKPSTRSHKADWGRDPFQLPPQRATSPCGRFSNERRLVGIVGGKKGRMAIFGHAVLQKGDVVGNETIVDIDQNRVTVARDGSTRIIAMQEAR